MVVVLSINSDGLWVASTVTVEVPEVTVELSGAVPEALDELS